MAEQDPDKAERMSEEIKAKLYSPGPKESLVTDQLIQVGLAQAQSNWWSGTLDINHLTKGVDGLFMNMKPSLVRNKEAF
jgi:hypothetical protein